MIVYTWEDIPFEYIKYTKKASNFYKNTYL
jgi:hypothetical protein